MRRRAIVLVSTLGFGAIVGSGASQGLGCVAIDPDADLCALGQVDCGCTLGGGCDPGLSCVEQVCVDPDGTDSGVKTGPSDASAASGQSPIGPR